MASVREFNLSASQALGRMRFSRWPFVAALVRWGVPAALLIYLAYILTQIGWLLVWRGMPTSVWFYLLLLAAFFVVPLNDLAIYRYLWGHDVTVPFSVLLRKKLLNFTLISYSGEAYFLLWAHRNLRLPAQRLAHTVKDNNVLSAGAGYVVLVGALIASLLTGAIPRIRELPSAYLLSVAAVPLVLSLTLVIAARRLTTLSRRQMAVLFSVHGVRGVFQLLLDAATLIASGSMPSLAIAWRFVVLRLVAGKIPTPNNSLLVMGVGIAAATFMHLSMPRVAATIILMSAAGQILNLLLVGVPWALERTVELKTRARRSQ
jgi:hypothetical protein